jgi:dihydrolipoamide dehydrogenase
MKGHYDLCVIGGGPAGYAAAMRAIDFGKKVLLIERDKVGGAGLYNGALSSKTMWEFSEKFATIRDRVGSRFDITYDDVKKHISGAVFDRKFQLTCHLKLLRTESKKRLFYYQKGHARFISPKEVEITKTAGKKIVTADHFIITTGSTPRVLPNVKVDEKYILTSDGIEHLEDFPKSMVIVGAGIVGCEYSTIFSNFGKTKVYLIDRAPRILPFEDEDVSGLITSNFIKKGVNIHRSARLERMEVIDGEVEYEVSYADGNREVVRVEKALLSIGRVPNLGDVGLENAGVKLTPQGFIETDDTQTSVPHIYAAGDVTGHIALVNVAEREGRHAVVRMFGPQIKPLVYTNISTIMFLDPEVASVGLSEKEATEKGISYKVAKIDFSCIPRAIAMRKTTGFFKLLVTNDKEMKVLGMRAVGEHASSAIQSVALLIYMNKGIDELGNMMHPHPSIIEGIQECARMLLGKPIFKSSIFKDKLKCYKCENGVCTPLENL